MELSTRLPDIFDYLKVPIRFKVAYGGRASGKSVAIVRTLLIKGMEMPSQILCCREYQSSIKDSVKSEIEKQIRLMELSWFYTVSRDYITGINGTQFQFHGIANNVENIKSIPEIHYAFVEEANTISKRSWTILEPTVRSDTFDSEIFIAFNPDLVDDIVYELFVTNKHPDALVRKVNYLDNPFCPKVSKRSAEVCKLMDYKLYEHVWLGELLDLSETAAITNWHTDRGGELLTDEEAKGLGLIPIYALDFGYRPDPTVLIKFYILEAKKEIHVVDEAYGYEVEIDHLPAFLEQIPGSRDYHIMADCASPGNISYLQRQGFHVLPAEKKSENSIANGIEFLRSFTIIVSNNCDKIRYELTRYSHKVDPKTDLIVPKKFVDKDNHGIDCLRYGCSKYILAASQQTIEPFGESLSSQADW